jgi:multidrug resistance efflux pump
MIQEKRIPLARSVRWRRIRSQTVPVLSFSLSVLAIGWLWHHFGAAAQGVGEVDSPRVDVTSPTAGLVLSLPHQDRGQWMVYDHVLAGDVIARIQGQQLENDKRLLQQEIRQLLDQLKQRHAEAADDNLDAATNEAVRRAWQYEQSRLLWLDEQLASVSQLPSDENRDVVSPPPELPEAVPADSRDALARWRETRHGLELRRKELHLSTQSLEIQSPISGTLVSVHCWPGQMVPPGALIATIAADYGRHIVGYIPEESSLVASAGMRVILRTRVAGSRQLTSEIEQVGRRIERIPNHLQGASMTPQWGTPVRIRMPSDALLQPGALVDVVFRGSETR